MSSSIFHFFALLVENRGNLCGDEKIGKLPFITDSEMMLFTTQKNAFPDMALRVGSKSSDTFLQSGALIELKNSTTSYTVTPFNSTIPFGIKENVTAKGAKVGKKIKDDPNADTLPTRHVYYLVRGRNEEKKVGRKQKTKICLVHGSFFEPNSAEELIVSSFHQVLDDAEETGLSEAQKRDLCQTLARQELFSRQRPEKRGEGYLSLQFRILVSTNKYGNIFKHRKIKDDTLNFIMPVGPKQEREEKARAICETLEAAGIPENVGDRFFIKHYRNEFFWVLQIPLG